MSPCSASDLHSIVHPLVKAFGNQASDDGLLALEVGQLVRLAVSRRQAEVGAGSPTFSSGAGVWPKPAAAAVNTNIADIINTLRMKPPNFE